MKRLYKKLQAHPDLREQISELLLSVEDEIGEFADAHAAELYLIDRMRQMGQGALAAWAQKRHAACAQEMDQTVGVRKSGKKTLLADDVWRSRYRGDAVARRDAMSAPIL